MDDVGTSPSSRPTTAASPTHSDVDNVFPLELKSRLEEALSQCEIARAQRTEACAEILRTRKLVDDLKDQKQALTVEMSRHIHIHKEDTDRIQALQRDLDKIRAAWSDKQDEIIELSMKVQELMARLEGSDQVRELKSENELLWSKLDELKRKGAGEDESSLQIERWRNRLLEIEAVITEAFEQRRGLISDETTECGGMLAAILKAEESLRRGLSTQLTNAKADLRTARDKIEDLSKKVAQIELDSVKSGLEAKRQDELHLRVQELERERDSLSMQVAHLGAEVELCRTQADQSFNALQSTEAIQSSLTDENVKLRHDLEEARNRTKVTAASRDKLATEYKNVTSLHKAQLEAEREKFRRLERELACEKEKYQTLEAKGLRNESSSVANEEATAEVEILRGKMDELKLVMEGDREKYLLRNKDWEEKELRMNGEIEELTESLRVAKESQNYCEDQMLRMGKQVKELKDEVERKTSKISQLVEECESQKEEIGELRHHLAAVEQHSDREVSSGINQEKLKELSESLSEAEDLISKLRHDLSSKEDSHAAQMEEREGEILNLRRQLEEISRSAEADAQERQAQFTKQRKELMDQLEEKKVERETLEKELQSRIEQLQSKVEQLQEELSLVVDGPTVQSLLGDTNKSQTPEQQIIRLKAAVAKSISSQKELQAIADMHTDRLKEKQAEVDALKAQIQKVEEGWRVEYEGYLNNLHNVNASLKRSQEETRLLQLKLTRVPVPAQPFDNNLANAEDNARGKLPTKDASECNTTDGESSPSRASRWLKERKSMERKIDALRKRLESADEEIRTSQERLAQANKKAGADIRERHKTASMFQILCGKSLERQVVLGGSVLALWCSFLLGSLCH